MPLVKREADRDERQTKLIALFMSMAFGLCLGMVYFASHIGPVLLSLVLSAGIMAVVSFLLFDTIYRVLSNRDDMSDKIPSSIGVDRSFVTLRTERRILRAMTADGKISGKLTGKEEVLFLEGWHWRILFSDISLPLLAAITCAWGMADFTGGPTTKEDLKDYGYAWLIIGAAALSICLIWVATHGLAVSNLLTTQGALRRVGVIALWVCIWALYGYPGWAIVESLFDDPGSTAFWAKWLIVSLLWVFYMAKTWLWGAFCVSNKRVLLMLVLPFGIAARIQQLSADRVSQYDYLVTPIGKKLHYGGLKAESDSSIDANFHKLFPLRHYREANEAIVEANS